MKAKRWSDRRSIAATPTRNTPPVHCREKIVLGGMKRSIGTVGVDYDNSLVETTIGFYKTGATRKDPAVSDGPLRSVRDVE